MHTLLIQHFTARNLLHRKSCIKDFHGSTMDKNLPASGGDTGLIHMPQSREAPEPQLLKPVFRACTPGTWSPRSAAGGATRSNQDSAEPKIN